MATKVHHLKQIDGLRGYLALWVALGHAFILAGYFSLPFGLGIILDGGYAVEVFIIISGFVITHLLLQGKETYRQYIVRRFFRLYPIYMTCGVIGFVALPALAHIVHSVPWQHSPEWPAFAALSDDIYTQTYNNTLPQLLAHLTMLHGLLPKEVLPRAALTFLPAAWSISLEWQFYLVAPLVIAALRRKTVGALVVVLVALALYALYMKGLLGSYYSAADFHIKSSLFESSGYFAIGIASRFAYETLRNLKLPPALVTICAIYFMDVGAGISVPLTIWFCFFSYLMWHESAPITGKIFKLMTETKLPLLIGSMSYSIYLIHRPLQFLLLRAAMNYVAVTHLSALMIQMGAILLTLPVSYMLYRLVEMPGQVLGRKAAAYVSRKSMNVVDVRAG